MPNFKPRPNSTWLSKLRCDSGAIITIELVLVSVVALIGLIVAFSTVRDSVVSELVDTSLAVQTTNQSLVFNGTAGPSSATGGSSWSDASDANDGADISGAVVGTDFDVAPQNESSLEAFLEANDFQFRMTRGGGVWTGAASFDNGVYNASPYWPGTYTIDGNIITIDLTPLGGGWDDGTIVLDASDLNNISGALTWINSISGFIWDAVYELLIP